MAWAGAKATMVTTLEGLSITSPTNLQIQRVYPNPPGTVQDWPAFIIYPPSLDVVLGMDLRERNYRVRLRLIISDHDMAQAANIADSFREALVPVWDDRVSLSGNAVQCWIERVEEVGFFSIGDKAFIGFDSFLFVEIKEGIEFEN